MRKGIFIRLESAHHLGYENAIYLFLSEKGHVFSQFCENAVNKAHIKGLK